MTLSKDLCILTIDLVSEAIGVLLQEMPGTQEALQYQHLESFRLRHMAPFRYMEGSLVAAAAYLA